MRPLALFALTAVSFAAPEPAGYGRLPLHFEPNVGQYRGEVRWTARAGGMTVAIEGSRTRFKLRGSKDLVGLKLTGAAREVEFAPEDRMPGVSNYYYGQDSAHWRSGVPHYGKVRVKGVYPGVDMLYYAAGRNLEYDFVVAPGTDPAVIELAWEGVDGVRLEESSGDIVLAVAGGEMRQHKPRVYQEIAGQRVEVAATYRVRGARVGFELAKYDASRPVVIDPVLSWGTFLGGANDDYARGIAVDASGAAYVVGETASADYPLASAHDNGYNGTIDLFVTKLSPAGTALVFSTYLGGTGGEFGAGIALDPAGAAYVVGFTGSADFPTMSALQGTKGAAEDAIVAKLGPTGSLVYSTFLGGNHSDQATAVAVDSSGAAYVTGFTYSSDFPLASALRATRSLEEVFITKISPSGTALVFSTFLGGASDERGESIAVDTSGAVYVTGRTYSSNFPTEKALQAARSGNQDAFVTKLNAVGNAFVYSTYLGGSGSENGTGVAVDATGSAYVAGITSSLDFPLKNPFRPAVQGTDGFVAKLATDGQSLVYSTYLGGSSTDIVTDFALAGDEATVAGYTTSADFPQVASAYAFQGCCQIPFVARFASAGDNLLYSTMYGTQSVYTGIFVATDAAGDCYVTGNYNSFGSAPVGPGFDLTANGNIDAIVSKLVKGLDPVVITVASDPPGLLVSVDNREKATPIAEVWQPGVTHSLSARQVQVLGSTVHTFSSWSQGGPAQQQISAPASNMTYTARYTSAPCAYVVTPGIVSVDFRGETVSMYVTTTSGCPWNLQIGAGWARVTSYQTEGSGSFNLTVDLNPDGPRSTFLVIGDKAVTINQSGGSAALPGPFITAPINGETFTAQGVAFQWVSVTGATGYDLRIYPASQQSNPVFAGTTGGQSSSTLVTVNEGSYDFYIRACSGGFSDMQCGPYRSVRFNVVLQAPFGSPTITFPIANSTLTSSTHELKWTAVPGATSYQVQLRQNNTGRAELTITVPGTSTIYSMGSGSYTLSVNACIGKCNSSSQFVFFNVSLPPVPAGVPSITSQTISGGNQLTVNWGAVANADIYIVQVIQPAPAGPGGGALTVATARVPSTTATLSVPAGLADIIVAACNGNGCGPYSAGVRISPPGPNPSLPGVATPISGSSVQGPAVFFAWSGIPGDNGSNTTYRLFAQDFSRQSTALDVQTRNRFYGAYFKAEGARYDALVVANPGPSQLQGPPAGFLVHGNSATAPTLAMPTHDSTVKAGMVQLGWTPVPSATLYEYFVAVSGQSAATARGVSQGLIVQVPLAAVNGQPTTYSGIVRACPASSVCTFGSDANWGPWSNIAGPGVTTFTVVP